jgi:fatty acid desaturase
MQPSLHRRQLTTGRTRLRPGETPVEASAQIELPSQESLKMLWTITIILFILWVLGLVSSYTMGGWIHILLVLAIIVLIFNLLSGRRAL